MMRRVSSGDTADAVTWAEWRDHMLLAPNTHVTDLFRCGMGRKEVDCCFFLCVPPSFLSLLASADTGA